MDWTKTQPLRSGDVVEVRSPAEILATLDDQASLDGVPFMPEMLEHVGRKFTVSHRVEKICDTIAWTGSRRMRDVVFLDDLRCSGSEHGGCQAGCRIYWKSAWLRRVEDVPLGDLDASQDRELELRTRAVARASRESASEEENVWCCQATQAFAATQPLKTSDVSQYWREIRLRNTSVLVFLRVALRGFLMEAGNRLGWLDSVPLKGTVSSPGASVGGDLHPGDTVEIRSRSEISATLDHRGFCRGLSFDREMLLYCGQRHRVKEQVRRIIDEATGRMIEISSDCYILDDVVCTGTRSIGRWFCPRAIYPYWRTAWLEKVEAGAQADET